MVGGVVEVEVVDVLGVEGSGWGVLFVDAEVGPGGGVGFVPGVVVGDVVDDFFVGGGVGEGGVVGYVVYDVSHANDFGVGSVGEDEHWLGSFIG